MAYVDNTFSITDEDPEATFVLHNRPPFKEIALAAGLLAFGALSIIVGLIMMVNKVGGDIGHGFLFALLGSVLFLPGFYYSRIAYYAYKGYKGFSFSNIPPL